MPSYYVHVCEQRDENLTVDGSLLAMTDTHPAIGVLRIEGLSIQVRDPRTLHRIAECALEVAGSLRVALDIADPQDTPDINDPMFAAERYGNLTPDADDLDLDDAIFAAERYGNPIPGEVTE